MIPLSVGVLALVLFFCNNYVLAQAPMTTRSAEMLPLLRRLNIGLAICGVGCIVVGLLFPEISQI